MVHKVPKHGNIFLELHLDRADLEKKAKHICTELLKSWERIDPKSIKVISLCLFTPPLLARLEGQDALSNP